MSGLDKAAISSMHGESGGARPGGVIFAGGSHEYQREKGEPMESPLRREFDYYLENQAELVKKYDGKFVVIKNQAVIGVYDDQATAVAVTMKEHELGTFLVQKVEPGSGAYTQTFHSRVAFAR